VLIGAPGRRAELPQGAGSVRVVSGVDGSEIRRLRGRRGLETRLFVAGRRIGNVPHLKSFDRRGRRREVGQDIFRGLEDGALSLAVIEDTGDPAPGDVKIVTGTGIGAPRDTVESVPRRPAQREALVVPRHRRSVCGRRERRRRRRREDVQAEIVAAQADSADGNVAIKIWERFSVDPLGRIAWMQQNAFDAFLAADTVDGEAVNATGGTVTVGDAIHEPATGASGERDPRRDERRHVGRAHLRRYGALLDEWLAFIPGGQNEGTVIALGDLDGDGINEIVTSPATGQSWIRAFDSAGTPKLVGGQEVNFFAFVSGAPAGIRLAVADVDLDGEGEIIVASGAGIDGVVGAFEPDGSPVAGWTISCRSVPWHAGPRDRFHRPFPAKLIAVPT
jgi:hypothetical protein